VVAVDGSWYVMEEYYGVMAGSSIMSATSGSEKTEAFRTLFFAAAAWNLSGAIIGFFFLDPLAAIAWPDSDFLSDPIAVQFTMMLFGLIGVLGISYVLVALDPGRNRGLVLTAAIGKAVVLAVGGYYSWSVGTLWLLLPAAGVLFFTTSFFWFLVSTRESGWY
jgi:hypothetical protein